MAMAHLKTGIVALFQNHKFVPLAELEDPIQFQPLHLLLKAKNEIWAKVEKVY